jgi:hypothetical protein
MQPAAAALYVELCDVGDTTIIAIWKHIYSFLGTDDILSGMLVCQSFSKELPSLVGLRGEHTVTDKAVHMALSTEGFPQKTASRSTAPPFAVGIVERFLLYVANGMQASCVNPGLLPWL